MENKGARRYSLSFQSQVARVCPRSMESSVVKRDDHKLAVKGTFSHPSAIY